MNGEPVNVTLEDVDEEVSYEDKLIARAKEKEQDREGNFHPSGMGSWI